MSNIRIFEYSRKDKSGKAIFACKVIVNIYAGSLCFNDITVPKDTPASVKEAFLTEAEQATLKIVEEDERQTFHR